MYVVCGEHLGQAIDEFVDVYEEPPDLCLLESVRFTAWTAPQHCDFCVRPPLYLVV